MRYKITFFEDLEDKIFERIASTRIFDLKKQFKKHIPTQEEILIEKQNQDTSEQDIMILYDGFELQNIITENISIVDNTLHIIFTNKLTATFDNEDFRYHARALVSSNPTIISLSLES